MPRDGGFCVGPPDLAEIPEVPSATATAETDAAEIDSGITGPALSIGRSSSSFSGLKTLIFNFDSSHTGYAKNSLKCALKRIFSIPGVGTDRS